MAEPLTLSKPTKYRCPKCKTEIVCAGVWSIVDITFTIGQNKSFSTGPVCPQCVVEFIKANIPAMEVVAEGEKP